MLMGSGKRATVLLVISRVSIMEYVNYETFY